MVFVNTILKLYYFKRYSSNLKPSVCNNLPKTCLFSCNSLFEGYVCYASVQILLTSLAGQVSLITAGVFEYFLRYLSFPVLVGIRLYIQVHNTHKHIQLYIQVHNTHKHIQLYIQVHNAHKHIQVHNAHKHIHLYIHVHNAHKHIHSHI